MLGHVLIQIVSHISGHDGIDAVPCTPGAPGGPGGPGNPAAPGSPWLPGSPMAPGGPLSPLGPFIPDECKKKACVVNFTSNIYSVVDDEHDDEIRVGKYLQIWTVCP